MTLAIPKPQREARRGSKVDTSGLAIPKPDPARDANYRAYVRGHRCAIEGRAGHKCYGIIEAAHIGTSGYALKASDFATVPLCSRAHRFIQHQMGWPEFRITYDFNPWEVAFGLLEKWHRMEAK